MFDIEIQLYFYVLHTSYVNFEVLKKLALGLNELTVSSIQSIPCCDAITIDLSIKQDGGCLASFVLQYFRN